MGSDIYYQSGFVRDYSGLRTDRRAQIGKDFPALYRDSVWSLWYLASGDDPRLKATLEVLLIVVRTLAYLIVVFTVYKMAFGSR
jgi:hypothetical protein